MAKYIIKDLSAKQIEQVLVTTYHSLSKPLLIYPTLESLKMTLIWKVGDKMKKLEELIYDQMELVKYMNESKTRTDRMFYKNEIDYIETLIEKTRKELNLY